MHRHMALVAEGRHPREPPVSRSDADTAWVANRPGYPTPVQPDGRRWGYGQRIPPIMGGLVNDDGHPDAACECWVSSAPGPSISQVELRTVRKVVAHNLRRAYRVLLDAHECLDRARHSASPAIPGHFSGDEERSLIEVLIARARVHIVGSTSRLPCNQTWSWTGSPIQRTPCSQPSAETCSW